MTFILWILAILFCLGALGTVMICVAGSHLEKLDDGDY